MRTGSVPPEHIAILVNLLADKTITGRTAKSMADIMCEHIGKDPNKILEENPQFKALSDTGAIDKIIDEVLAANESSITDFKNGKDRAFNYLVGQIMKASKGMASPDIVKQLLSDKLS